MAGFMMGLCVSPTLAIIFSHTQVTVLAFLIVCFAFLAAVFFFPETLPPHVAEEAKRRRALEYVDRNPVEKVVWNMMRPIRELSILNRNSFFRLISCVAFFSGMVSAGDQTLLIYYVEEKLSFTMTNVAILFLCIGTVGVFAQAVLLKPLNDLIGERLVVALCFFLASINNLIYGVAQNKATIFIAVGFSGFGGMAFPTISAIKANNVVSLILHFFIVQSEFENKRLTYPLSFSRTSRSKVESKVLCTQYRLWPLG
jgi:Na+/melibiose symporter-like transporter